MGQARAVSYLTLNIGDRRNLVVSATLLPNHSRCGKEANDDDTLLQERQLVLQTFTTHGIPVLDNRTNSDILTSVSGLLLRAWGLLDEDPAADVALCSRKVHQQALPGNSRNCRL